MSAVILGQHFRSFLIKLSMIEAQLGPQPLGGLYIPRHAVLLVTLTTSSPIENISFAIVIELQDNKPPTASNGEVLARYTPRLTVELSLTTGSASMGTRNNTAHDGWRIRDG